MKSGRPAAATARLIPLATVALLWAPLPAVAQTPAQVFEKNCSACHTVGGGPRIGPDLKGVTDRKDREWLTRFIVDPQAVIDTGDAYAQQLVVAARGFIMPAAPEVTPEVAMALLDYLDAQSRLATGTSTRTSSITDRAFSPADVQRGRDLFVGAVSLAAGGPACIGCHRLGGLPAFGGGALGPELTRVYDRLQGRPGLGGWLTSPATVTMQKVYGNRRFTPDEVEALLALLEDAAAQPPQAAPSSTGLFLASGIGGAVLGLVILGWAWRGRFRSVRRRLVGASAAEGTR